MADSTTVGTPETGDPDNNRELRALAVRRLKAKQGLYRHATVYALVNLLLVVVWLSVGIANGAWFPWPIFPIVGWGIGLAMHAWEVSGGNRLREDRIQSEMEALRTAQPHSPRITRSASTTGE